MEALTLHWTAFQLNTCDRALRSPPAHASRITHHRLDRPTNVPPVLDETQPEAHGASKNDRRDTSPAMEDHEEPYSVRPWCGGYEASGLDESPLY
jgi:hypothetical protein